MERLIEFQTLINECIAVEGVIVKDYLRACKFYVDRMVELGANTASLQGPANFGISAFYGAGDTPRSTKRRTTAAARAAESSQLEANLPVVMFKASVWPSTITSLSG